MKSFRWAAAAALQFARPLSSAAVSVEFDRIREDMAACIDGRGGDVGASARAMSIANRYAALPSAARRRFFELLAEFDVDHAAIDVSARAVLDAREPAERDRGERALRVTLTAPRMRLLRAFNSLPAGVKLLVEMRADLIEIVKSAPDLAPLAADFKELLASWFDVGFLEMRRITWDAPASLLEKLGRYEAVHEVRGWADLKNRLDVDRRCFAFLHPAMPDEPLIFVEVALTTEMSSGMAGLLDQRAPVTDPSLATHAIFYSISNCQRGLDGISLGNALIKRVVQELAHEFRHLRAFVTLSPIPRFREWLDARGTATAGELPLRAIFVNRSWARDNEMAQSLRIPLLRLCAHYLLEGKRAKRAYDPVAHFHLGNGARLERINWLADTSAKGMRESAGMMVNYLYRLDQIDENQIGYATEGRIVASQPVLNLLVPPRRLPAPARTP